MSAWRLFGGVLAVNGAAIAAGAITRWPAWTAAAFEDSPLTWFSSVQLVTISLVCGAHAWFERRGVSRPSRALWVWAGLAAAFGFFALDERFTVHERLRDRVLAGHVPDVAGVKAGNWFLPLVACAGVAAGVRVWRALSDSAVRRIFALAVALSACAVLIDVVDIAGGVERLVHQMQFAEELLEHAAQAAFLSAFLAELRSRIEHLSSGAFSREPTRGAAV